ncbi:MAG: hypothetical protein AB7I50_24540 [Vicinamibacterales bacterium]
MRTQTPPYLNAIDDGLRDTPGGYNATIGRRKASKVIPHFPELLDDQQGLVRETEHQIRIDVPSGVLFGLESAAQNGGLVPGEPKAP